MPPAAWSIRSARSPPRCTDSQVFTELTHGEETVIAGDSAPTHQMLKVSCRQAGVFYLIHDKGSKRKPLSARQRHRYRRKSSLRSKVELPFRLVKRLWGHATVRYRGLVKNTIRLHLLFALSNLYQVRRTLLAATRPHPLLRTVSTPRRPP
ncbi:MAG: transposase [Verrucomicrobia bacterium]|nr:transposase [Verrucomicrobiota bacterium]